MAGLFDDTLQAERAVGELVAAGFDRDDIGLAARDRAEREELDAGTGIRAEDSAGTLVGGRGGGLMEKIAAWLNPESGDDLVRAFTGHGYSEAEARRFDEGFRAGRILVTVRAGGRSEEARSILQANGADLGLQAAGAGSAGETDARRLALREEELNVSKRPVEAGEVRVRKEVHTEERQIDVPVTREEVVIERRPASPETADAGAIGQLPEGEEIRVPIMEEEVKVDKTQRVREEVTLGKRTVQDTRRVQDTVRREEAHVETAGDTRLVGESGTSGGWSGRERRRNRDLSYAGPERRLASR
ncbi:MAG TPA: YsnF/AvaK domain-containing protein [Gemmatimonadales bacterium]|nr:YsnF/AvaK domain-containing protein [Gemmatimonadales bacterium]